MATKTATVQAGQVSGTNSNFPAYVDLADVGITTLAEAQSVRVYSDSGLTTELAREIVSATEMHVKIPSMTSSTQIWVDYDGARADYAVGATYGRNAVWTGYEAVWHGNDTTTSTTTDVTGNSNNGTKTAANQPLETTTAVVDKAQDFSGGNYSITLPNTTSYESNTAGTISTYMRYPHNNALLSVVGYGDVSDNNRFAFLGINTSNKPIWQLRVQDSTANELLVTPSVAAPAANTYTHVVFTSDGATDIKYYQNGVNDSSPTISAPGLSTSHSWFGDVTGTLNRARLGSLQRSSEILFFTGFLDETRIASDAKSANWITTEYNNLSDNSAFWGTWTTAGAGPTANNSARRMLLLQM